MSISVQSIEVRTCSLFNRPLSLSTKDNYESENTNKVGTNPSFTAGVPNMPIAQRIEMGRRNYLAGAVKWGIIGLIGGILGTLLVLRISN